VLPKDALQKKLPTYHSEKCLLAGISFRAYSDEMKLRYLCPNFPISQQRPLPLSFDLAFLLARVSGFGATYLKQPGLRGFRARAAEVSTQVLLESYIAIQRFVTKRASQSVT